jgi:nitrate reductase alpha subunit
MSYLLDRLTFFRRPHEPFSEGHGAKIVEDRRWEDAYRNRWRHDKIARSTHGVNCTGSCSWRIHVKDGVVVFETQAVDYPRNGPELPDHEPRGCQRGASFSWYLYSPHRIKYPMIRRRLLELYRAERASGKDPVEAWTNIQADSEKRRSYTAVRGLGGFVRTTWEESTEIIAAANVYTIKKYGPDRIIGFSPIPAMSMVSFTSGSRYMSLIGATMLSFYDWYCDLPPSSPQTWGEQTDVPESAAWYQSSYIIVAGTDLPTTRSPDAHFYSEARYRGTKIVAVAPDYSALTKFSDLWMPVRAGTDAALFMAMSHVVLKEFFIDRKEPYFIDYVKNYTDLPVQVLLRQDPGGNWVADRYLRAIDLPAHLGQTENAEWKTVVYDTRSQSFRCPNGSVGFRWENHSDKNTKSHWNLKMEDAATGEKIDPSLTVLDEVGKAAICSVMFPYFAAGDPKSVTRKVPYRQVRLDGGDEARVCSVFDLMVAHYGVDRGLDDAATAKSFDDAAAPYTPAWQEEITGIKRADVIRTAREFADTAAKTKGRAMVIMGAGTNHWYHDDMNYRSVIGLVELCGCVGQTGGGWAHYVGQERLRPLAGFVPIMAALDWNRPPRQMNATSFWYLHTDQWRYERVVADQLLSPTARTHYRGHTLADYNVASVRMGWLPGAPYFDCNPLDLADRAEKAGAKSETEVAQWLAGSLEKGDVKLAFEDVDDPINWPRNLFVWRGNLIGTSAKGHEYFLKHLLGAQNAVLSEGTEGAVSQEIKWHEQVPVGKLDLMVDFNFRLNSTGATADIVLPAATWYEKYDLNTTDMHTFIHPLTPAVDPAWDSRSDWQAYRTIAHQFSKLAAKHLGKRTDLVATPLMHDSPSELGQALGVKDWGRGEAPCVPGKNAPQIKLVERDYALVGEKFETIGPLLEKLGNGFEGVNWDPKEEIAWVGSHNGTRVTAAGERPLIDRDEKVCDAILALAPETNGEVAMKAWRTEERHTGLSLTHLVEGRRSEHMTLHDLTYQPRRCITAPNGSGIIDPKGEQTYNFAWTNVHERIPFRTLTGRAQLYQDHEWMLDFGEGLVLFRPPLVMNELLGHERENELTLRFLTPHGKWGIHSTFQDNLRLLNLSRGGPHAWINEVDAESVGIRDNDWMELTNVNGVTVVRAVVSQKIPEGVCIMAHQQEKTINVPGSPTTHRRGGNNNAVTRVVVKPTHMIGGYAHLSWGLNYYGTVGCQRDTRVRVRRFDDKDVNWLEGPLTEAIEREPSALGRFQRETADTRGEKS